MIARNLLSSLFILGCAFNASVYGYGGGPSEAVIDRSTPRPQPRVERPQPETRPRAGQPKDDTKPSESQTDEKDTEQDF